MRDFNRTKIMATISLERANKECITKFISNGVSVFRINSSHSSAIEIDSVIKKLKKVINDLGVDVGIMQDLQGPKIRIGEIINNGVEIVSGQELIITEKQLIGNNKIVSTTYSHFINDVNKGEDILIDDGKLLLTVKEKYTDKIVTEVKYGGILKSRKGINLPKTNLSSPSLTAKDREDLVIGLENEVEWIALSFVRKAEDIIELKEIINKHKKQTKVISKIEKPEALKHIDEIIKVSDAVMVARGDLGVEIPMENVPIVQKYIVSKCNREGKPVIIATQMMESMIEFPTPTRAEINDIANAVMDKADVLMLSGETAVGKYPQEVIYTMQKTIVTIENNADIYNHYQNINKNSDSFYSDCVVQTTCKLAESIGADAIIGTTASGYTAFEIAKNRPKASIFIFTDNKFLLKTLSLIWGIRAFYYDKRLSSVNNLFEDMERILINKGLLKSGDICIHTGALPINKKQRSNMLKISEIT